MILIQRIRAYYNDPEYFHNVRRIAVPIIIQQFAFAGLNMLGVIFVGQKGDEAVAAVGLAGQLTFLLTLVHFGIISGAAMFTAQFWGRNDVPNLRRVLGLCLMFAISASLLFFAIAQLFPTLFLSIYTEDPAVIEIGAEYVRTFSWSFLFLAVTVSYAFVLRSTGNVKMPTTVSVSALLFTTFLSYSLIFGRFGFPELGIQGAAVATVIARSLEMIALVAFAYLYKTPVAASLRELTDYNTAFASKVIKPMIPVILNELLWALGITTYNAIYGRMGTSAFAAMNIVSTIEQLAFVIFIGISNATAVLVGNRIGAGRGEEANIYAGRSLGLGAVGGVLMGILLQIIKAPILSLYNVSPGVIENASNVLTVMSLFLWVRINNMTIVIGILRAGGDTRFSLVLDGIIIWIVGVPMAYLGANVFNLPVYYVYLCAMSEEVTKWFLGMNRYRSRKWIHDLTQHV
jgi:putative MATE family efflux protein